MIRQSSPSPGLRALQRRIAMDQAANETDAGRVDDADQVDPRDDMLTQLYKFLSDKISSDDLAKLEQILCPELGYDAPWPKQTPGTPLPPAGRSQASPSRPGAPLAAMDSKLGAASRRVNARLAMADARDLLRRFPQAGRLRQGF